MEQNNEIPEVSFRFFMLVKLIYTDSFFRSVILKNHSEELVNGQKFDGQKINRIPQKFVLTTVRKANSYETWTDAPLVVRTCSFKTDFKKS